MNNTGLSYDQAPPFIAPLPLYLIAPLFLLAAALGAIFLLPDWLQSRASPAALALTHLLTLGFLGLSMCASLLQMLPVVIGSAVPAVRAVAMASLVSLSLGTPTLAWGLWQGEPAWLTTALVLLTPGLGLFAVGFIASLRRAPGGAQLRAPLFISAGAWVLTVALGLSLVGALGGHWPLADMAGLSRLHQAWGLLGWIAILVVGVSWQVVPMLQLTPTYPARSSRLIPLALLAALLLRSLESFLPSPWLAIPAGLLAAGAITAYALQTQQLYRQRRRKISDATLHFWRIGMASLIFAAGLWALRLLAPADWGDRIELMLGMLFLLGFATSVVTGMLYKIVPFLCWFHLQAQRMARKNAGESITGITPSMKAFIPDAAARRQFQTWAAALALLLPAPLLPPAASIPGLLLLTFSAAQLWQNLWTAARLFRREGGRLV